jgi:hypothetical protein
MFITHLQKPSLNPPQHSDSLNSIDTDDLQHQIALLSIVPGHPPHPQYPIHHPQYLSPQEQFQISHHAATLAVCTDPHSGPKVPSLTSSYRSRPLLTSAKLHAPSAWLGRSPSSQSHQRLSCISCRLLKIPCMTALPGSVDQSCK